ncbi:OmpA family protein, partial [Salmonella enterica]|nr:OmpA family protein [Salmonella enterica]
MRRSVIIPVVLHALVAVATLLWLLWYFIPTGNVFNGMTTLLILLLAGWYVFKNCRSEEPTSDVTLPAAELPLPDTRGPVVLVCGDGLDALFQEGPLRKTAQGWWLRAGDVNRLTDVVRSIQTQFPRQVGQLSVMYRCLPDHHQDEAVLRSALKTLRQQCKQIKSLTGFTLPVVLSAEFSGPETPWIIVRGDKPIVCPVNDSPQAFIDWQQAEDNILALSVVSEAFSFIRNTLADELEKPERLTPPERAFSVAMRLGTVLPCTESVWAGWLYTRTCLQFSRKPGQSAPASLFPDAVLPLLAPFASTVQGGQRTRRLVLLIWLCALTALGISALNNRDLIRQVSADLQRWNAIPMNHYRPKAESLAALKQDALLLERWQRQGEPLRYSLGYYPGQRLWLALQQAIDTWTPPPAPEPKLVPKIVRLDSMSLFDSGKSVLKPGSTKMLVNALVGIKARPGWLIVVSGHT